MTIQQDGTARFQKPQNEDNQAHLAYFDTRTQASFVWDGHSTEIQVCLGGYGEPTDHTIKAPARIFSAYFNDILGEFRDLCRERAEQLETFGDGADWLANHEARKG